MHNERMTASSNGAKLNSGKLSAVLSLAANDGGGDRLKASGRADRGTAEPSAASKSPAMDPGRAGAAS